MISAQFRKYRDQMRSEFGVTIECLYHADFVTEEDCKKCGKCYAKSGEVRQ